MHPVRRWAWLISVSVFGAACTPDSPRLDVVVMPNPLRRGAVATVRVLAEADRGEAGRGFVRLESDVGSLTDSLNLELDAAGEATAEVSCPEEAPGCRGPAMTVTATWQRRPFVSSVTTVRLMPSPGDGGVGSDAGAPPDAGLDPTRTPGWMEVSTGFFLDGAPGSYVLPRRVFEPNGPVSPVVWNPREGTLMVGLGAVPQPGGETPRPVWTFEVAAPRGEPLRVGRYTGAQRSPFHTGAAPGLSFSGEGRGCNTVGGSFEVHELVEWPDGGLAAVAVTFEHWCEGIPRNVTRGWVRVSGVVP
jgi:hypothetical protein